MGPMTRTRRARSALLAAMLAIAAACGDDGTVESRGTDPTTSTVDATPTTAASGTSPESTVPPPASTSTTIPPTSSSTPPPTQTQPPAGTGVSGTVTAGPTCPVAQAENPCDPRPVDADVEARSSTGAVVASAHTDDTGGFDLQLAPATYTLVAVIDSMRLPRCSPVTITVPAGEIAQANINCDTGIR